MFEGRIDKLSKKKRNLALKKEKMERKMRERNSVRDTKIKILENEGQNDYEKTMKQIEELDRKIKKTIREIDSEQIYVNEVAKSEKAEYETKVKADKEDKTLKGMPELKETKKTKKRGK